MRRQWSAEEDAFLRENYGDLGAHAYHRADILGITAKRQSVRRPPRPREAGDRAKEEIVVMPPAEPILPVAQSDFIRPLTKERLMGGKA